MLNRDRVKSEEELLIREMLYGNIEEVLKKYSKEKLKRIFLKISTDLTRKTEHFGN